MYRVRIACLDLYGGVTMSVTKRLEGEEKIALNRKLESYGLKVSGSFDDEKGNFFVDKGCSATCCYEKVAKVVMDSFALDKVVLDGTMYNRKQVEEEVRHLNSCCMPRYFV